LPDGFHELFAENAVGSRNQLDLYGQILGLQEIEMEGGAGVPELAVTKSYRGPSQSEMWAAKASPRRQEFADDINQSSRESKSSQYPGEKGRPAYFDEPAMFEDAL